MLTGRPDNEHAAGRDGIARHHLDKAAGIQIALDEMIRKPGDAEPCYRAAASAVPLSALNRPCG